MNDTRSIQCPHLGVEALEAAGFELFDVQFENEHLVQFGVVEIPDDEYVRRFDRASRSVRDWPRDDLAGHSPSREGGSVR